MPKDKITESKKETVCSACQGSGWQERGEVICPKCKGAGK